MIRHVSRALGLAALYAVVSLIGRALLIPDLFIAPIRLSIGVACTALLLNPRSTWWIYLLALLPFHLWQRNPTNGITIAMQYFAASAVAALVSATLMRWWIGQRPHLDNLKTCMVFLVTVVLAGPLVGASIGTASIVRRDLTISGATTWETWLFAESVGCLVAVPVMLAIADWRDGRRPPVRLKHTGEAVVIAAGIAAATFYTLDPVAIGIHGMTVPMLYLPFPFLLWAAIRFGPTGAAVANFELTLITIVSAMRALGPFGGPWSVESVVSIQQFLVVTGATTVTLGGLAAERRRTVGALTRSQQNLQLAFRVSGDLVMVTRARDGKILEINDVLAQMQSSSLDGVVGRQIDDVAGVIDVADRVRVLEALRAGNCHNVEVRFQLGGRTRNLLLSAEVLDIDDTKCVLWVGHDITDLKATQSALERAEAQLQQTRKMEAIGQLAGGIAHDFNNLLQAIHGYAQMASSHLGDGHAAGRPVDQILSAADRAAALTRQLLSFSRRQPVAADELDLNAVVTDVSNLLRRLIGENVTLRVATASGLPRIVCDRTQIEQVIMNLCINARDAMKQGGRLTISTGLTTFTADDCKAKPWARQGSWVFLAVADEGDGIPDHVLPHIFEPFFTTKGVGEGTGLGLSTVYAVISRRGGLIDVETKAGEGTRVTVFVPVAHAPGDTVASAPTVEAPAAEGHETILLAEDDELLRQLAEQTLKEAGYEVLAAHDGEHAEALARANTQALRVAVLDVVMPKRSGRKVSDTIRILRPDLPIVFMSGYTFGALDDLEQTGTTVLQKPFTRQALLKHVRDALDRAAAR